jgi:hypothetical protein
MEILDRAVLQRIVSEWSDDTGPGRLRPLLKRVLPYTTTGGVLAKFHPGNVTIYRGASEGHNPGEATSWSTTKKTAQGYGRGKGKQVLQTAKLTRDIPALDLDLVTGATGHQRMDEVIVAHKKLNASS